MLDNLIDINGLMRKLDAASIYYQLCSCMCHPLYLDA